MINKAYIGKLIFHLEIDYKVKLKEEVANIESEVKHLNKIKADKDDEIFALQRQIHEINTSAFRIDETLENYKDHLKFIEDVYEFKGMQKIKRSGISFSMNPISISLKFVYQLSPKEAHQHIKCFRIMVSKRQCWKN